jgi:hypothetical protein
MDNVIDFENIFRKEYPNRILKCTEDSNTVKEMRKAEIELKLKGGISFYCGKRHKYIYIPNTK